jgi:hypothetical protein
MYREFVYYMSPIIKGCWKHIMHMESGLFSNFTEQLECKKLCKHLMYRETEVLQIAQTKKEINETIQIVRIYTTH